MTVSIAVRHTFEAAHRLPHLNDKCASLHGHSWGVVVHIAADAVDDDGVVLDFGRFKRRFRAWVDEHLDHGAMLAATDPLAEILAEHDSKVFRFGARVFGWQEPTDAERHALPYPYPTVELVAHVLFSVAGECLAAELPDGPARVVRVDVTEKHDNSATAVDTRPVGRYLEPGAVQ